MDDNEGCTCLRKTISRTKDKKRPVGLYGMDVADACKGARLT